MSEDAFRDQFFAALDSLPPEDIVPREPSPDDGKLPPAGTHVTVHIGGGPIEDADGNLVGMTEPIEYEGTVDDDGSIAGWLPARGEHDGC